MAQVYATQNRTREVNILARSKAIVEQVEYDNWNRGTYGYELILRLPVTLYGQIEKEKERLEKEFLSRLGPLLHGFQNEYLNQVVIGLEIENDENWRKKALTWVEKKEAQDPNAITGESSNARYDAFISHASEDKELLVRPLAKALRGAGHKVWYDEFELLVGDSLRQKIDKGLADSNYGIVVLSPSFFSKNWPQYELDGLVSRQMIGEKVILPIWHGVTRNEIMNYSPALADKLALDSNTTELAAMVGEIGQVLGKPKGASRNTPYKRKDERSTFPSKR